MLRIVQFDTTAKKIKIKKSPSLKKKIFEEIFVLISAILRKKWSPHNTFLPPPPPPRPLLPFQINNAYPQDNMVIISIQISIGDSNIFTHLKPS